ncbi:RNA pseudouridylate synthase domain containing 3 (predicted), isoform CRA_c [Rattus norvegicus]|uniref:RNA pseudouridine synthase D3 n=2 Tax=Rattus norvegicus TaxID=10116 RepID=D4A6T2_RAT|nr:mitochondrial mRNA pseudouridine synthase RPUSD3 isoform 2 [Rattus norvegicus]EDL91534.1 RNA pseudouridylate synthase domain containing 3 (predicted), isoform CRA_c [Rattus norvegicus]|eukprot:NP_001102111.1 RNA pseudouridylate synthase domain-containing protein 3 [Rattus norvegicus]
MEALRALRSVSVVWRPGLGSSARRRDAGFGTEARKRKDLVEDQPFPGLLRAENLGLEELAQVLRAAVVDQKGRPGELTLLSVLPWLSQALGLEHQELQVVRAPGKEASGLVLLSSCPQTTSHLQKFFTHSRRAQRPTATYCAITDGVPEPSEGTVHIALRLERMDGIDLAVPVTSPSRKDIQEGVKRTLSHFHVTATGCGCALVQLQPLTVFPSQLQVHMALQLCPILGDHTYAARVGSVLGQRFLWPAETTKPQRQVLDEALLRYLHLSPSQVAQMPLHLHLHRLLLPGTRPRDPPSELLAPLPPYFSRTLQCLRLSQQ